MKFTVHIVFPSPPKIFPQTHVITYRNIHQNHNPYEKNNLNHPFGCRSGGSVGAEARQENREVATWRRWSMSAASLTVAATSTPATTSASTARSPTTPRPR